MNITIYSFGFKHGHVKADLVYDVRFLPNPYWVEELKSFTGKEARIAEYVLGNETGQKFLDLLEPLLEFLFSEHQKKGREEVHIAIGCTGGKHRSVAVVEHLRKALGEEFANLEVYHRDIGKE